MVSKACTKTLLAVPPERRMMWFRQCNVFIRRCLCMINSLLETKAENFLLAGCELFLELLLHFYSHHPRMVSYSEIVNRYHAVFSGSDAREMCAFADIKVRQLFELTTNPLRLFNSNIPFTLRCHRLV